MNLEGIMLSESSSDSRLDIVWTHLHDTFRADNSVDTGSRLVVAKSLGGLWREMDCDCDVFYLGVMTITQWRFHNSVTIIKPTELHTLKEWT